MVFAGNKEESGKIQPTNYHTVNYTQSKSNQHVPGITDIGQGMVRKDMTWQDKAGHGKARQGKAGQSTAGHGTARHGKVRQSSKNEFADKHTIFPSKSRNYNLSSLPHRKNAYLCRDVVGTND